ncbi:unnamed protein product [Arabis nemorensis]|uniref:TF-B3 domain-containing protein n=1 Tax=Arabis nemorensis TaxID=586526 RepID=A0A565B681_9BRAS|nr:unnamed protein product [Arabis nemorensis]
MENGSTSSPRTPLFFQPLLPGFHSHIHLAGTKVEGSAVVKLRSDASDMIWEVKMDGRRLTQGWQKFVTGHNLQVGDIVVFRHDGDLLFHVTPFGPIGTDSDSEKCQHTREAGSSSDHSCFLVARVTASNLIHDLLLLPMDFSRSNGLMNRKCEIILLNEYGKPWRLLLGNYKSRGRVYIKSGWKSFCCANRRRANDLLTFKLVQTGTTPVIQLCSSSFATSQYRLLTLSLTTYTLQTRKLCLPATFLKANGIEKARKITLVDRYGVKRTTSLKPEDKYGRMRLGKEWIEFCEVNGVKTGDSFKLELIYEEEDTATHLLKFCSKV